jgi:hypothetical protein
MIVWTRTCSMNSPLFPCKLSEEKKCCLPFTSSEHGKDEEQHSSQLMFLNENAIAIWMRQFLVLLVTGHSFLVGESPPHPTKQPFCHFPCEVLPLVWGPLCPAEGRVWLLWGFVSFKNHWHKLSPQRILTSQQDLVHYFHEQMWINNILINFQVTKLIRSVKLIYIYF